MDIQEVNPGPRRSDVLTLQSVHRSELVWQDPDVAPLKSRRADSNFWKATPLDTRVEAILLHVGFYGVYMAGSLQVDHSLITALVERWRPETHTFHLPVGEATVTLQDIEVLWGLPVDGNPVTGVDCNYNISVWQTISFNLLGYIPSPDHFDGDRLKLKSISMHLDNHILNTDSTDLQVLQHARCRMLQIIASLMGDKSGTKIKLMYLLLLEDINQASEYSWGSATLASLYRALCRACFSDTSSICGPLCLLQLWAWERLPTIGPQRQRCNNPIQVSPNMPIGPRASMWKTSLSFSDVGSHVLRLYRDRLDYLQENDFIWQPYSHEELQLPAYCHQGRDIWSASVPLINFDVVELYFPQRVMRQFGYQQHVPDAVDTGMKLHKVDRRGRKGVNWSIQHAQFIQEWESRRDNIILGVPVSSSMAYFLEYMGWYRQITRLLIGNPEHRPERGVRPIASIVEYWSECWEQVHSLTNNALNDMESDSRSVIATVRDICAQALSVAGETRRISVPFSNFEGQRESQQSQHRPSTSGHRDDAEEIFTYQSFSHMSYEQHNETPEQEVPFHMTQDALSQQASFRVYERRRRRGGSRGGESIPFRLELSDEQIQDPQPPRRRQPRRNARHPSCGT